MYAPHLGFSIALIGDPFFYCIFFNEIGVYVPNPHDRGKCHKTMKVINLIAHPKHKWDSNSNLELGGAAKEKDKGRIS